MTSSIAFLRSKWVVAVPVASALLVMIIAGTTRDWLEKGHSSIGCCNASRLALPPSAAANVPSAVRTLTPEMYAGRLNFIAAMEIYSVAILAALAVGILVLVRSSNFRQLPLYARIAIVGGSAALLTFMILDDQSSPALQLLLKTTVATELPNIRFVLLVLEQSTVCAATLLVAASALQLRPPRGSMRQCLEPTADGYRRLSLLLTAGTLLLAADVLAKAVLMQWAETYFDSDASRHAIHALGQRIVVGWGVYDSLLLASTYVPTASILKARMAQCAEDVPETERPQWINPQWLSDTPIHDLARLAAILAPFAVGQVATSLLRLT